MNEPTAEEVFIESLTALVGALERPAVQLQILALILALLLAWILGKLLQGVVRRLVTHFAEARDTSHLARLQKLLPVLAHLYFPVLALLVVQLAVLIFVNNDLVIGLLLNGLVFLSFLLVYWIVAALLHMQLGEERARYYRHRLMLPILLWIFVVQVTDILNLRVIGEIRLFTLSETDVTIGRLFTSFLVFYFFLVGSSIFQDFLRNVVFPRTDADPGVVNTVLAVTRYFLIILAVVAGLAAMGFSLSTLAVIGGGLSIGIGFGLQQVIANFIAGLLLLFEQSLRPGDVIELNGEIGTVEKLSIRSTLVRTLDNVELIIPNETFLTSAVKTYTKSNRLVRIPITVGVSYSSDPGQVSDILMGVAESDELVRDNPPPTVLFNQFGDSSLLFQLNVWVDEPIQKGPISSKLHYGIWQAFREQGIEIPFPQRDLNLGGGWEKLLSGEQHSLEAGSNSE